MPHPTLTLESLANIPVLPRGSHIALLQKCCVCFDSQGFESGLVLVAECAGLHDNIDEKQDFFRISWSEPVDDAIKAAHADLVESVEDSAKAIGMLLLMQITPPHKTCRQAVRGTHIDYYLVDANTDLPFQTQHTAGVEFTGILAGVDKIEQRMRQKRERLHKKRDFPVYIVCVEHSFPVACIERVDP